MSIENLNLQQKVDISRIVVMAILGTVLLVTRPASSGPMKSASPDQPTIDYPSPNSKVNAGITEFKGHGKPSTKIEVLENGRILAEGWVGTNREWKATGKLRGSGRTAIFVRGNQGLQSPPFEIVVNGSVSSTLEILKPQDQEYLESGLIEISGKGKPGNEILISYNGRAIGKVNVNESGKWAKTVRLVSMEQGIFKAYDKSEGEIVIAFTTGPG